MNLLVVEDNRADSKILISFLKEAQGPLHINVVNDGEAAVRYLAQKGEYTEAQKPDAVLLDINLPRMSGFEVLSEIRNDARVADIPVYILSSSRNPDDIRKAKALKIAGFFQKPTEMADFKELAHALATKEFIKQPDKKGAQSVLKVRSDSDRPAAAFDKSKFMGGEDLYKQLIDSVRDYAIYMIDPQGTVLTWNEGAQHLTGYRANEIIGKSFSLFYPQEALKAHHPLHAMEVATSTGRFQEEGWRIRKDGTRFWASVTLTAIRDRSGELVGFGKVTRDFTARKESERRVQESERRFRLLIESVKDYAIFMLTTNGTIASWNVGAERINGYKASEAIGKHFSVLYTNEALERDHPTYELKEATEKGVYEEEGLRVRKDGSIFWAHVVITAIYDEDSVLQGFAKVTRDITDKKQAEDDGKKSAAKLEHMVKERTQQLEESRRELMNQRDQLLRSNTDLQQFAYIASHDLQEPLRSVVSCLQFIEMRMGKDLPAEMQEYMGYAVEGAFRMRGLIEGLLQYGRIGQGLQTGVMTDLNRVMDEVLQRMRPLIETCAAEVSIGPLPTIYADFTHMAQVFQNLIANAIKYRSAAPPRIEIRAEKRDHEWEFTVSDNGLGIAPEYFERIFVIFHRLHSDRQKYPGTGIGLAICKRIVEGHKGKIWVTSKLGEGTTFHFTLPA